MELQDGDRERERIGGMRVVVYALTACMLACVVGIVLIVKALTS